MERTALTPGKLFARLSAEFRRRRGHLNCRMPMVLLAHRVSPEGPNWTLEPAPHTACEECMPLVVSVVAEASEQFDLKDPTALPTWPSSGAMFPSQTGMRRQL